MSISVSKITKVEKKAKEIGISGEVMMENAGANAARAVDAERGLKGRSVIVFCGTGNNAGDGLVFARHALIRGADVRLYMVKRPESLRTDTTRKNFGALKALQSMGLPVKMMKKFPEIRKSDILVDALLGTGVKETVREDYVKVMERINASPAFKVSLDSPSGISCDTGKVMGAAVRPDLTVTFHERKKGLNRKNSGKIVVVDIGIPKI